MEISVLNAHYVREPLSRVVGLVNLMMGDDDPEGVKEILPMLKVSADDLDAALQDVIQRATNDLIKLKA